MTRRHSLKVAAGGAFVLVSLIFLCVGLGWALFDLPPIPAHNGAGIFTDTSRRVGPFPVPGYTISMPDFDLSQPYEAEYRLSRVPKIGSSCGLHLAIRDHDGGWWAASPSDTQQLGGQLRLQLLDSEGRAVINTSGTLGDYIWSGFKDLIVLYQTNKSSFRPDLQQEYRAHIWYTPDAQLAGYKGFVYFRAGGRK
jgi:hypothetical protein